MSLREKIRKAMVSAMDDFAMLEAGDQVMVAVSGGKDSAVLLHLLLDVQRRAPFPFTLTPVILDQKQPGFDVREFRAWVEDQGTPLDIIEEDTYRIVTDKVKPGKSFCGLCSRLRRGILYRHARERGFHKIALGHHRDDLNETLLLNLFFNGTLASMPPRLYADDGYNQVIRPLAYVREEWLTEFAREISVPIIPCNLCGSQENMQRQKMKALLGELAEQHPDVGASMARALSQVRPSQLADRELYDFTNVKMLMQRFLKPC